MMAIYKITNRLNGKTCVGQTRQPIVYISKRRYFFTILKTELSNRYILVGDILLGELKRWHNRQIENEKSIGDSYVYRCTRYDGRLMLHNVIAVALINEILNAQPFRHTHATDWKRRGFQWRCRSSRSCKHHFTLTTRINYKKIQRRFSSKICRQSTESDKPQTLTSLNA